MDSIPFGNNQVALIDKEAICSALTSHSEFDFSFLRLHAGNSWASPVGIGSFSLFVESLTGDGKIVIESADGSVLHLSQGNVLQIENSSVSIQVRCGSASILFSGAPGNSESETVHKNVLAREDLKRVNKPWGHEIWVNGEHPHYAFKEIFIKKGFKTSLQYHEIKEESNFLFRGEAKFYTMIDQETISKKFHAPCVLNVPRKSIHRIEALSDILLYETSTPHLDDVIRLSDDTNRVNGRIDQEHGAFSFSP